MHPRHLRFQVAQHLVVEFTKQLGQNRDHLIAIQPRHDRLGQRIDDTLFTRQQPVEGGLRKLDQPARLLGTHGGAARPAGQNLHLADRGPRPDFSQNQPVVVRLAVEVRLLLDDFQLASDKKIERIDGVSLAKQNLVRTQHDPRQLPSQVVQVRAFHRQKQRTLGNQANQFFRRRSVHGGSHGQISFCVAGSESLMDGLSGNHRDRQEFSGVPISAACGIRVSANRDLARSNFPD